MTRPSHPELPLLENALLWAVRIWVIGQNRHIEMAGRIGRMFENLRAPSAASGLHGLMQNLRAGAKRQLEIDCICQPAPSADESLLLDILALQQEGYCDEARALLGDLAAPAEARSACANADRLVSALNLAGHHLPRGQDAVRRHAFCHRMSARPHRPQHSHSN